MTKLFATLLIVLFSQLLSASDYIGVFEQKMTFDLSRTTEDKREKVLAKFNRDKFTLTIDVNRMKLNVWGEEVWSIPYEVYGPTLVGEIEKGRYWVLYVENSNTLHSSDIQYVRVADVQP